jgi:hypothetical protein
VYALVSQASALLTGETATASSSPERHLAAADLALDTLTNKLANRGRSTPVSLTNSRTVSNLITEMARNSPGVVRTIALPPKPYRSPGCT